jgi:glutamyl-tRNA reductase
VPIVEVEAVRRAAARRHGRPLVLLDIAVPRDVDPNVRGLPGVQVFDLDDLERECPLDVTTRRTEIERAEALAAEEAERIVEWVRLRAVGPAIVELRGYAEDIRVTEIRRSSARLKGLTPEQNAAVEALTAGIVNKLLHGPTVALRDAAARPGGLRRSQSRIVRVLRLDRGARTEDTRLRVSSGATASRLAGWGLVINRSQRQQCGTLRLRNAGQAGDVQALVTAIAP